MGCSCQCQHVDSGDFASNQKFRDLFERRARVEQIIHKQNALACYITIQRERARDVIAFLREGLHFLLRFGLVRLHVAGLHGFVECARKHLAKFMHRTELERLKSTSIMLILCGSYIGMMETEVLSYKAPLYGRRTNSVLLEPMDLPSASLFFPRYSPDEKFLAWAVAGGMPYYLRIFSDQKTILQNIRDQILDPLSGELFNEPRLLLMEELGEPRNYFSILRAVAEGITRLNEIAQTSGVGTVNSVSRYLDLLQQMRLVTRRVPATESHPEKCKRGLYQSSAIIPSLFYAQSTNPCRRAMTAAWVRSVTPSLVNMALT